MPDLFGLGAYGIQPYLSEDFLKQIKYAQIKTRAGKIAYIMTLGEKAPKPKIEEGVTPEAKGAIKWIKGILDEKENL